MTNSTDPVLFWAEEHPLSNFYPSPIEIEGETYPTVEHYYQAQKFSEYPRIHKMVIKAASPGAAKALSQEFIEFVRPDWDSIKEKIMYEASEAKYLQNPELLQILLDTRDRELIQNNPDDSYWGQSPTDGMNRMGVILMHLRNELRFSK